MASSSSSTPPRHQGPDPGELLPPLENDLEIVAALNKIDLPAADPDRYAGEIEKILGIPADEIIRMSAKTGEGVPTSSMPSSNASRRRPAMPTHRCRG